MIRPVCRLSRWWAGRGKGVVELLRKICALKLLEGERPLTLMEFQQQRDLQKKLTAALQKKSQDCSEAGM
jgi:hypothetical protein